MEIRNWQKFHQPPPQGGGGGGGGGGGAPSQAPPTQKDELGRLINQLKGGTPKPKAQASFAEDVKLFFKTASKTAEVEEEEDEAATPSAPSPEIQDFFRNFSARSFMSKVSAQDLADGTTDEEFMAGASLDQAVENAMRMASLLNHQQQIDPPKKVPITPLGTEQRRAIIIAQSMIDRLCAEESDDIDLQNEFEFDPVKLMELKINPMRGLRSAMVGRKRAPVGIFVDFSGSCNHVSELFGLIMTGFAHEGGTLLIGGNGEVHFVYQPFENCPLHRYAQDFSVLTGLACSTRSGAAAKIKVRGGYLTSVDQQLSSFTGHLIACTDDDSYSELIQCVPGAHIIYCEFADSSRSMQSVVEGKRLHSTDSAELARAANEAAGTNQMSIQAAEFVIKLALRHHVYLVNDIDSLTDAMAKCR